MCYRLGVLFLIMDWIDVNDETPYYNAEVLAYTEGGSVVIGYVIKLVKTWCEHDGSESVITHWMPLPEPPDKQVSNG
jgi:hypothetical protein